MGDPRPVISIGGDLTKPVTTLIEKISDAVGGAFRPRQMRRVAQAEVDVEIIKAKGAIELSALQHRALERFIGEEAQKQANIEAITDNALPQVNNQASPENMDRDWITHFFDRSRLIADEEAQVLWSRLLAGEANEPGTFSKRTINVLASLDKFDAELFVKLCSFVVDMDPLFLSSVGRNLNPLIYSTEDPIYKNNGIDFDAMIHLETLGLVHNALHVGGYSDNDVRCSAVLIYFGKQLYVELPDVPTPRFDIGGVLLTQSGQQLARLAEASPVDGFDEYLIREWKTRGYKTEQ